MRKYFKTVWSLSCLAILMNISKSWSQSDTAADTSRYFLKEIRIEGKAHTKKRALLKELSIHEGETIHENSLAPLGASIRLRLMNTKLFNDVQVKWEPQLDGTLHMVLHLSERFPIMPEPKLEFADRNINVWWNEMHGSLKRINIGLALEHRNFRGNREVIGVSGQIGYTKKASLSYENPFIDKSLKHGIGAEVSILQNREIAYATDKNKLRFFQSDAHAMLRIIQASAWYTYRPQYAKTHKAILQFQHFGLGDSMRYLNPNYLGKGRLKETVLSLGYEFRYNGVDNWDYPLLGMRFIGLWNNKLAVNGGYFQSSLNIQFDKYWNPRGKWYVSTILRAKASLPNNQPYIFQNNLGYDYSYVRGYEYYVIDGAGFNLARVNLKRELLNTKIKLPIKYFQVVPIRIYAKVFADAGIAYGKASATNEGLRNKALYSAGIGIDFLTLYDIKIRLEYTINHQGERDLYLHQSGE